MKSRFVRLRDLRRPLCGLIAGLATTVAAMANNPPQALPDTYTVHNNGAHDFPVLVNDSDPDPGDTVALSGPIEDVNNPLSDHATVTKVGSQIRYVANAGFVGTDTFRYRINDGALFHSAIVTVTVTANQPPVASPDSATADVSQSILIDVLSNDSDPEGDALTLIGPIADTSHPPDDHATVIKEGTQIRYTPNTGYIGTDTFRYRIYDGALFHSAIVTVEVGDPPPGCTAPAIVSQPTSTSVDVGDPASFSVVASGTAPLSFQWNLDGSDLPGATQRTLTINDANGPDDAGNYQVRVSNACGSAVSQAATLTVLCDGPGDILSSLSDRVVARPIYCDSSGDYRATFPISYSTSEFNTPVLAAAFRLVDASDANVRQWWLDYLDGELGAFSTWQFGAKETFSGIYQYYNLNAVLAVHHFAEVESRKGGANPQYGQIAGLARQWLRASLAFMATAAVPSPTSIGNDEFTHTFGASTDTFVALAGPRYRHIAWSRLMRSMIFERGVSGGAISGEPGDQKRLLNHLEANWPNTAHSVYGLTANEKSALLGIKTNDVLPGNFLTGYLAGVKTLKRHEFVGWSDGTRLTFMPQPANYLKAPTFANLFIPGDTKVHTVYPYTSNQHANPGGGTATLNWAARSISATGPSINDGIPRSGVSPLPRLCDASFHLVVDATGARLEMIPNCGSGSTVCLPPASTQLLGHWDFEQASNLGLDSSSAGRHATSLGSPGTVTGRSGGEQALSLDGTSALRIPGLGEDLDQRSAITVMGWMKVPMHSQMNAFRVRQPIGLYSDRLSIANYTTGSGWSTVVASPSPPVGSWYHLAGVFDSGSLRIYVDGQLAGTTSVSFTETDGASYADWSIGARELGGTSFDQPFVGDIDDLKVFTRVLSDDEIARDAGVCP